MSIIYRGLAWAITVLVAALATSFPVRAQADRITQLTSKTDLKHELYNYLLTTKQSTSADGL
jgi:hypothetical protein